MPSIPSDFIEQVRSAIDIASVVSEHVALKPSGKSFKGLCPFHNEKTPSFNVNPERQIFHCFGCDQGGDVFKFVMLYEKVSFVEAVRELANRAGLKLPRDRRHGGPAPADDRGLLARLNEEAQRYFVERLSKHSASAPVRAYLQKRGLDQTTIDESGFGFAPEQWSGLLEHLTRKGAKPEQIAKAGLVLPRKSGGGYYDRFRGRLTLPIHDESGRVVAFGARILGKGEPKYLNSPESPIYNKSRLLYGFRRAKDAIRKEGFAILMEGYFDCIQAYQAGVGQAVACCGTSLTTAHAQLLRRFTDQVVINFDPDAAGQRAARRSIDTLLEEGFDVRVLQLPDGEDPDNFIRRHGGEAYRQLVEGAVGFVDFLIDHASQRYDVDTPRGKAALLGEVLPVIAKIPNRVERVGYAGPLAERARISDEHVVEELRREVGARAKDFQLPATTEVRTIKLAERELIRWVLEGPEQAAILEELEKEDLEGLTTAPLLLAMREIASEGELSLERVLERLPDEPLRNQLTRIIMEPSPLGPKQSARDCLNLLREERWKRQLSRLRAKMAQGVEDDNLTAEIQSLARRIASLAKLGRVETTI